MVEGFLDCVMINLDKVYKYALSAHYEEKIEKIIIIRGTL